MLPVTGQPVDNIINNNHIVNANPPGGQPAAVAPASAPAGAAVGAAAAVEKAARERFRDLNTFEFRQGESARIRGQYPDRVPVIVELHPQATKQLEITKTRFLPPGELALNKFMLEVRKVIKMERRDPLSVKVEDARKHAIYEVSDDDLMNVLYQRHKDDDGFLYILFSGDM